MCWLVHQPERHTYKCHGSNLPPFELPHQATGSAPRPRGSALFVEDLRKPSWEVENEGQEIGERATVLALCVVGQVESSESS